MSEQTFSVKVHGRKQKFKVLAVDEVLQKGDLHHLFQHEVIPEPSTFGGYDWNEINASSVGDTVGGFSKERVFIRPV